MPKVDTQTMIASCTPSSKRCDSGDIIFFIENSPSTVITKPLDSSTLNRNSTHGTDGGLKLCKTTLSLFAIGRVETTRRPTLSVDASTPCRCLKRPLPGSTVYRSSIRIARICAGVGTRPAPNTQTTAKTWDFCSTAIAFACLPGLHAIFLYGSSTAAGSRDTSVSPRPSSQWRQGFIGHSYVVTFGG